MTNNITVEFDVCAEMRDGTNLYANVFRPADDKKYPIAIARTPYCKDLMTSFPLMDLVRLAQGGYIVVVQDVRGRYKSEGEWIPHIFEFDDGYDSVEWSAQLPGSNGNVGMWGFSYLGFTQWAAAVQSPPHLKALMPMFTWASARDGLYWRGGALELGLLVHLWLNSFGLDILLKRYADSPNDTAKAIGEYIRLIDNLPEQGFNSQTHTPLQDLINLGLGEEHIRDLLNNPNGEKYNSQPFSIASDDALPQVPAYHIGGWYDIFSQGTIDNFIKHSRSNGSQKSKLLVGPWSHLNLSNLIGEKDFGMTSQMSFIDGQFDLVGLTVRWFDYWLKDIDNGIVDEPPVNIFVSGKNKWVKAEQWPLKGTKQIYYYLRANGELSTNLPTEETTADTFAYDPNDPVSTYGGSLLMHPVYIPGVRNQEQIEICEDVLNYTSEPLTDDLQVIGRVVVHLWASSSAADTDFVARLVDIDPQGFAHNLSDGIIRTRYSHSGSDKQINLSEPAQISIDLWSIAHVFKAGHSIRLDITSSNYPRWDRNPNKGQKIDLDGEFEIAQQTIYHDQHHPSTVILPIVTREI